MASESHGVGVVRMALANEQKNNPILLVGLELGAIMGCNVMQTPKLPVLSPFHKYSMGHEGAIKAIREGPSSNFYTGDDDATLLVWQITGDSLGI
jgi:hypothetical protein